MPSIDHLGIAVKSLAAARSLYERLGLRLEAEETVEHEKVRVALFPVGESRIELIEATADDSAIARFIAKRGEGLHHIALRVPDLGAAVARLKQQGTRFVNESIQTGAGGHRYVFVHPSSAGGVLLELVEDAGEAAGSVFLLWHVLEIEGTDDEKLIGVYRTEQDARAAIERLRGKRGFVGSPDGFVCEKYELNRDQWTEGFAQG